ncbi:MAG TPA: GvpL/GvpF family gas vesicle protein [Vicinamibacterales bacterium]|nr:GvpL/GvpF family gas vesicle protein [Vicinamibacterales bacterium]
MSGPIYVYAIVEGLTAGRFLQRHVELMEVAGFEVVCEHLREPPPLSEARLRAQHEIVVRIAARAPAVLPVRFGAWLEQSELEAVLRRRRRVLRAALGRVRGRVQMTIRLFGRSGSRGAVEEAAPMTGTAFLKARRAAARPGLPAAATAISAAVQSIVADERIEGPRGTILVTLHHLLERSRVPRYRRALSSAGRGLRAGVELTVSGPWPPFAFTPELLE